GYPSRNLSVSVEGPLQYPPGDLSRIEVFLRQGTRQSALPVIVGRHLFQRVYRLLKITKSEQPRCVRKEFARTGMLHNRRLAAGHVAQSPIARNPVRNGRGRGGGSRA